MEARLADDVRAELQRIGDDLDAHQPIRVKNGGVVILAPPSTTVLEQNDEQRQAEGRPSARSRQGPTGRQGSPGRSGSSRTKPRVVGLADNYARQLEDVQGAYPGAALFPDESGVWLFARSRVLDGLAQEAIFLIALPSLADVDPRGWAFWERDGQLEWIGPRHTNFPDGSVCAYHPKLDQAWVPGGDLRTLLDIYSLWALRQLHLKEFGRWPGRQHAMPHDAGVSDPYYRLIEFHPSELCSCGSDKRYGDCCRPIDLQMDFASIKAAFELRNGWRNINDRAPPEEIAERIARCGEGAFPCILDVLPHLKGRF